MYLFIFIECKQSSKHSDVIGINLWMAMRWWLEPIILNWIKNVLATVLRPLKVTSTASKVKNILSQNWSKTWKDDCCGQCPLERIVLFFLSLLLFLLDFLCADFYCQGHFLCLVYCGNPVEHLKGRPKNQRKALRMITKLQRFRDSFCQILRSFYIQSIASGYDTKKRTWNCQQSTCK